eukprot:m.51387 g.51387  ORF g.51387 m.51387 type:complete len:241 (+) comp10940_c0_seq1:2158-2880(+)
MTTFLDVDKVDKLYEAISSNNIAEVEDLLRRGVDVNRKVFSHQYPLHLAISLSHINVAKLILSHGADVNLQDVNGLSPLHIACKDAYPEAVELLLSQPNIEVDVQDFEDHVSPLHLACISGNIVIVQKLIESGANVNCEDLYSSTPCHKAAESNHPKCIRLLLKNGGVADAVNSVGNTPLHRAARHGFLDSCFTLMAFRANPSIPNNSGKTARDLAVRGGYDGVAKLLLDPPIFKDEDCM